MSFYRVRDPIQFNYGIDNKMLDSVVTVKDIEIIFSHDLNFRDHIESIV